MSEDDKEKIHEKSHGEAIYAYVGEYRGTRYLHIREWYIDTKDKNTEKPTKKGVAIPLEKAEALLKAVNAVVKRAK